MQSKATSVSGYVSELGPEERTVIQALRKLVLSVAPRAKGVMSYGMPVYQVGSRSLAFNAQKNYFAVYVDPEIIKRHRHRFGNLDVGKCCIRFRKLENISLEVLREVVEEAFEMKTTEPNKAPHPIPVLVTNRAPSSTLRAKHLHG